MSGEVPVGLADMPTGPELCGSLAALDPAAVPDELLLEVVAAQARQLAYQQARVWAALAELACRDPFAGVPGARRLSRQEVFDAAVEEVRAELRWTRRAAQRELEHAVTVMQAPRVAAALAAGRLDPARALVLAEGCADLTATQAGILLDQLLDEAGAVTVTGLAERVRRVAIALDPAWAERRYRQAVRQRRVIGYLNPDGSATVAGQYLPAGQAAAACARVDALASAAKRAGAGAPVDHLRAELFLGLLDGRWTGQPETAILADLLREFPPAKRKESSVTTEDQELAAANSADSAANSSLKSPLNFLADKAVALPKDEPAISAGVALARAARIAGPVARRGVEVKIGLTSLLGVDDQPGEIAGWGPVPAAVARELVSGQRQAQWRFAILDDHGRLLFDGVTRHRPRDNGTPPPDTSRAPGGQTADPGGGTVGGIVELHVPLAVLQDPRLGARYPEWAGLLADLAGQYVRRRPIGQNPAARFAGPRLRRRQQIAFQRCIFPGCRRPAPGCDLDHRRAYMHGGATEETNLAPVCRHDHRNKTERGWRQVRPNPTTIVWLSPLGRRHVVTVPPVAAPLPAPVPRNLEPDTNDSLDPLDPLEPLDPLDNRPSFWSGRPRGRSSRNPEYSTRIVEADPDPPPF